MKVHTIHIVLGEGDKIGPEPVHIEASIGDVIRWHSAHGAVTIHFKSDETPFASAVIHGDADYMILRSGTFPYLCTLRMKDTGQVIARPDYGGDVKVSTRGT